MTSSAPPQGDHPPHSFGRLPLRARLAVGLGALGMAARERRSRRALFFSLASLMVGMTLAGGTGLLICGAFGGSLYLVVLMLRMQRHLRVGTEVYRAKHDAHPTAGD